MSILNIPLRSLLRLLYASGPQRTSLLRNDIRGDIKKATGGTRSNGGDFYAPFWADAKRHIEGKGDLEELSRNRIAADAKLSRLYKVYTENLLYLLGERLRWTNELPSITTRSVNASLSIPGVDNSHVKLSGCLYVQINDTIDAMIYPYFSERPSLSGEAGRLGLWAMSKAVPGFSIDRMHIVDLVGRQVFSKATHPFYGDELEIFTRKYNHIIADRDRLSKEY